MTTYGYRKASDLPEQISLFPLGGALLFARGSLPLNIFEPRYLNMIDDALAGQRLIGMVQTTGDGSRDLPEIANIGCVGRIISFAETEDGRYMITLAGISRFQVDEELDLKRPYRVASVSWDAFESDLSDPRPDDLPDRQRVVSAFIKYVERNNLSADFDALENVQVEAMVNALCSGCPFSNIEKQALVEANGLKGRAETLIALMEMDRSGNDSGWVQ